MIKNTMHNQNDDLFASFSHLTDEELVLCAQGGNELAEECIYEKYKPLVRSRARSYFLIGADKEDIIQEGMIGLCKAVRDYNGEKNASFRAFAELCITRQIITAIKSATRQKHMPLNGYVSLNQPMFDESERLLIDAINPSRVSDPEELVIKREELAHIELTIDRVLTPLERKVLNSYVQGKSYTEIAAELDRRVKCVDNALQRIKRKMEKLIQSGQSGANA